MQVVVFVICLFCYLVWWSQLGKKNQKKPRDMRHYNTCYIRLPYPNSSLIRTPTFPTPNVYRYLLPCISEASLCQSWSKLKQGYIQPWQLHDWNHTCPGRLVCFVCMKINSDQQLSSFVSLKRRLKEYITGYNYNGGPGREGGVSLGEDEPPFYYKIKICAHSVFEATTVALETETYHII